MIIGRLPRLAAVLMGSFLVFSCQSGGTAVDNANGSQTVNGKQAAASPQAPDDDGFVPSGTGTEKESPAAGTGNVQGRVLFNEKPAADIEVKLCEKFSRFMSGCGGKTFTAKTDASGEYLLKGVPPGVYEGLVAKVFDTNYYVFATSGIVSSAKYRIDEGKTYFAPDTNLFKSDLKVTAPKSGSKLPGQGIEVKWDAYPDAAYYKLSLHGEASTTTDFDNMNKRVDGTSFSPAKPLAAGEYRIRLEAFNGNDVKLAESASDHKFIVSGGTGQ